MYGFVNSNYAGITGIQMNPTSIVNSKLYFDSNLIGAHLSVDNNFIYLARNEYKFSRFLSVSSQFPKHGEDDRVYYDYYNQDLKNAYAQIKIIGPALMYSKNDKAFGISTSIRNIVSAKDIPYEIAKFGAEGFDYYPLHRIRFTDNHPFRAGALSFGEVAATYAQVIRKQNREHWTAGITLKGLFGFGGAYWNVDNADYMLPNGDTMIVYNANGKAGISIPMDYSNNDVLFPGQLLSGMGVGADIGITYQLKVKGHTNKRYAACEQPFEDYHFKIGVSLIDFGYVNFNKRPKQIELKDAQGTWYDFTNQNIETFDVLFGAVSGTFGPDSSALITTESFKIFLPSALSAQFDYRYNERIYINASIVHPLVLNDKTLVRPSTISLTPRYESDRFEVAVPITLYEYLYPRIGLSFRFSKIIIGTDKLGGFFGLHDFTGMDLYFMVKFPLIKGHCLGKGRGMTCGNSEYRQYQRDMKRLKVR
ncbi:MAG: DUF5723 family protein [Chloroflexota bacterium]